MGRIIILRFLDSYFRHRWLYPLPILVMTIFGLVYFLNQERIYISSGLIFTEQNSLLSSLTSVQSEGFSWNTPAQDATYQISDLIRTNAFIRAVIGETDLEAEMSKGPGAVDATISEVRKRIWASVAGSNQVQISAAYPNPRIAYQLAQATIKTFIQWKINLDRTDSVTAGDFFQELITGYQSDVVEARQALKNYLETHSEPVRGTRPDTEDLEIKHLQAELDFATTRLSQALDKAENARLAETQVESDVRQKYTVVDAPDIPGRPATSRRQMAMNAAVFVAAGVLLSGIAVLGATAFERSFRIPLDVRRALDLPLLAIVPEISVPVQEARSRRWGVAKNKGHVRGMPTCPRCQQTTRQNKAGKNPSGSQRYRCRHCGKRYTPNPKVRGHALKAQPALPDLRMKVPGLVHQERSRRRQKKVSMTNEIPEPTVEGLEEAPIVLDLQALESDYKPEQKVRR